MSATDKKPMAKIVGGYATAVGLIGATLALYVQMRGVVKDKNTESATITEKRAGIERGQKIVERHSFELGTATASCLKWDGKQFRVKDDALKSELPALRLSYKSMALPYDMGSHLTFSRPNEAVSILGPEGTGENGLLGDVCSELESGLGSANNYSVIGPSSFACGLLENLIQQMLITDRWDSPEARTFRRAALGIMRANVAKLGLTNVKFEPDWDREPTQESLSAGMNAFEVKFGADFQSVPESATLEESQNGTHS